MSSRAQFLASLRPHKLARSGDAGLGAGGRGNPQALGLGQDLVKEVCLAREETSEGPGGGAARCGAAQHLWGAAPPSLCLYFLAWVTCGRWAGRPFPSAPAPASRAVEPGSGSRSEGGGDW